MVGVEFGLLGHSLALVLDLVGLVDIVGDYCCFAAQVGHQALLEFWFLFLL